MFCGIPRGETCPSREEPCGLLEVIIVQDYMFVGYVQTIGHRGRDCHLQRDVGSMEMIAYFRIHNFMYYNPLIKQFVEFSPVKQSVC